MTKPSLSAVRDADVSPGSLGAQRTGAAWGAGRQMIGDAPIRLRHVSAHGEHANVVIRVVQISDRDSPQMRRLRAGAYRVRR